MTLPQWGADSPGVCGGHPVPSGVFSLADTETLAGSDLEAFWGPTSELASSCSALSRELTPSTCLPLPQHLPSPPHKAVLGLGASLQLWYQLQRLCRPLRETLPEHRPESRPFSSSL